MKFKKLIKLIMKFIIIIILLLLFMYRKNMVFVKKPGSLNLYCHWRNNFFFKLARSMCQKYVTVLIHKKKETK